MTDREQIWQCAKRDLILATSTGAQDVFLWEHTRRVTENALRIAALPEVSAGQSFDLPALEAAALYHDAGWGCQYRDGAVQRCDILARPTSEAQHELGADLLGQSLAKYLKRESRDLAVSIVRGLSQRPVALPEGQVVSDAESLDEIGNLALWGMLRRHAWEGKGMDEAVRTWNSQRDFRFWEARIDSAFHFEVVKRMATARLERVSRLRDEIARMHSGEDLPTSEGRT